MQAGSATWDSQAQNGRLPRAKQLVRTMDVLLSSAYNKDSNPLQVGCLPGESGWRMME